jgi:hypothetical protein
VLNIEPPIRSLRAEDRVVADPADQLATVLSNARLYREARGRLDHLLGPQQTTLDIVRQRSWASSCSASRAPRPAGRRRRHALPACPGRCELDWSPPTGRGGARCTAACRWAKAWPTRRRAASR